MNNEIKRAEKLNSLQINQLINYLYKVLNIERQIYQDKKIKDTLVNELDEIENEEFLSPEPYQEFSGSLGGSFVSLIFISLVMGGILGGIGYFVGSIFMSAQSWGSNMFFIGIVLGIFISFEDISISLSSDSRRSYEIDQKNQKIKDYNNYVAEYNEELNEKKQREIPILKEEIKKINLQINQNVNLVKQVYSYGPLYNKYYGLIPVSSFIEYFESGRTNTFVGPFGAYSVFEDESRKDLIITNLNVIIDKLDTIINNQHILYCQLAEANRKSDELINNFNQTISSINRIEENSQLTNYHLEQHENYLKNLEWMNSYQTWFK